MVRTMTDNVVRGKQSEDTHPAQGEDGVRFLRELTSQLICVRWTSKRGGEQEVRVERPLWWEAAGCVQGVVPSSMGLEWNV